MGATLDLAIMWGAGVLGATCACSALASSSDASVTNVRAIIAAMLLPERGGAADRGAPPA